MTKKSVLQQARAAYEPKLPQALKGAVKAVKGAPTQSVADQEEINKKKRYKNKNKNKKNLLESPNENEYTGKKRKIEYFSDAELNDDYLDKLKAHLYINTDQKRIKTKNIQKSNLIIDLTSSKNQIEDNISNNSTEEPNSMNFNQEKINLSKLIIPKII